MEDRPLGSESRAQSPKGKPRTNPPKFASKGPGIDEHRCQRYHLTPGSRPEATLGNGGAHCRPHPSSWGPLPPRCWATQKRTSGKCVRPTSWGPPRVGQPDVTISWRMFSVSAPGISKRCISEVTGGVGFAKTLGRGLFDRAPENCCPGLSWMLMGIR